MAWAIGGYGPGTPRWLHVTIVALLPVACSVLYLVDPSGSGLYPLCPFRAVTGLYCPGCGTLRAGNRLLHGRIGDAFSFNSLTMLMLPVFIYAFASSFLLVVRGKPLPRFVVPNSWLWALAGTVIAFGVLRNIPAYPFTLLAP
ncbi:MAG: DUF2752 domain-containing protein [Actinomycetota bacterium]|nr:DUF2752 domain-containing protein [Actinomycetota bacterium]